MADDPMNVDQNGHAEGDYNQNGQEEGDDDQNVEEEAINRPLVQLPRFGVVRERDFLNRVTARRVPIGINGGEPDPVLDKYLERTGYDLLSVDEAEGADDLLSTLTEEEWRRASPAPAPENNHDFVRVFATGPNNVEYELQLRHGVREELQPPYYELTHGWSRIVIDYELLAGDYVEGDAYRDVEDDQLRLELRFFRGTLSLNGDQNVQEERADLSGPQSEKREGNEIGSSSARGDPAAAGAVSRERNQAPPPAARTPRIRLPRFGVARKFAFLNSDQPAKTQRVPTNPDGGGGAVLVLEKDLGLTDADADHNLLSVSEADGAGTLLRALTDGEWRKASPTNVEDFVKVLATGPNDDEYELRPRHRVLRNEPPECDLTHGWSRVVSDFGLKAGNRVENPNVQEENQEDGEEEEEEEEEGEGGGLAAAAA